MTDREMEKVRSYFQKRRDSGGGDCGFVEKLLGNSYQVGFKEREDQERVLLRKFHTISLPNGDLQLIVSRTETTETPSQPKTSLPQTFRITNTKNLKKTYHLDLFLLHFLRDSPKAFTALEKQLSSLGCEVELNFDEEEAVVRGDVDKGPGGAFGGVAEKWEQQVDRVIHNFTENYVCHHQAEARLSHALLQNLSLVNEDIRVYTDNGFVVLVGKAEAVNKRSAILTKSMPIKKEKVIIEKQLRLIEAEFSQEMCANYPDVTLSRSINVIVMEGQEEQVQAGVRKLDELLGAIKSREIHFPTPLLNFIILRNVVTKYQACFWQSLRHPVSVEIQSSLLLSSLSTDTLDKVQAALEKDLNVSTIQLQGAAAVSPGFDKLKVILIEAQNEANHFEYRVDVSFIPGINATKSNKVRLVGFSSNVLELQEIIQDYQLNKVTIQEAVNLSTPEFVDCFDKILELTRIELTDVTLEVSRFPNPCVILSGPRRKAEEAKQTLNITLASLTSSTLVLEGTGAQRYFQARGKVSKELVESSFQVIIKEQQQVPFAENKQRRYRSPVKRLPSPPSTSSLSTSLSCTATSRNLTSPINRPRVAIKLASLENEQVNVLVAPMVNKQLNSTAIGKSLLKKARNALQSKFDSVASSCSVAPGDVLQVDGPPSLGCSKIFFIECLRWDGARGTSVQALKKGLQQCLHLCTLQGLTSVAFPVIGSGKLLKYPLSDAIAALTYTLGLCASSGSPFTVHIVIKPGRPDSDKLYRDVYRHLNMNHGGEAIFTSLTSDLDDMTIPLGGGVQLRLVFGDITKETTDVVVNPTDFTNFGRGVCKDILTLAGPEVEEELKAAKLNQGSVVLSQPGCFPCKAILHVCSKNTAAHVEELTQLIVTLCESSGFTSVAIPAISTGIGGMQPGIVAGAMLRGIAAAATSTPLHDLRDVRVVLYTMDIFLAFQEEAIQMFHTFARGSGSRLARRASQQQNHRLSDAADLSILSNSPASHQSIFLFVGLSRKSVDDAMAKLNYLYEDQCSTFTFTREELDGLGQEDMENLQHLAEVQGLYVQKDQSGGLSVSGQKDCVNQAMMVIHRSLQGTLRKEVRIRQEEDLYSRVVWCIMNDNGFWERLPQTANYNLEKQDISGGIVDAQGATWTVDLNNMEASSPAAAEPRNLKRLENLPDFTVPLYWDSMAPGENMKVVEVPPSSAEYRFLKSAFQKTVPKTVMKIERLQNKHLRRAYEGQKTHISEKNVQEGGAGEKLLYHGTTHENCNSIMKTGFNRRFSGQNGTSYGAGVYFAVNANYSAHPRYSRPAADGSQVMFVARVLTGVFAQGNSSMNVPPVRDVRRPHECFDSVVDRLDSPTMFVVFHDNQSYPDYLITFR